MLRIDFTINTTMTHWKYELALNTECAFPRYLLGIQILLMWSLIWLPNYRWDLGQSTDLHPTEADLE